MSSVIVPTVNANPEVETNKNINNSILMVDNVKITPAEIRFIAAYDENQYEDTLIIQNCGVYSAMIRIEMPSSSLLKIKTIIRGERIPPGFNIKRKVQFTFEEGAPIHYTIPIYINDQLVSYKLQIAPAIAELSVIPTYLDYGLVDMGHSATRRNLTLNNGGTKPARFSIDFGNSELQMYVEPIKGVVQPNSSVIINVEINSLEEGEFHSVIYIKSCLSTLTVKVSGKVTVGRLEICNMATSKDFAMIDFPRTYYGGMSTQRLLVRNSCAARTVFCVLFEDDDVKNMENFYVYPMDGRMEPREARVFSISYRPAITKGKTKEYDFAIILIKKLNYCKDMNINDYPDGLYSTLREFKSNESSRRKNISVNSVHTQSTGSDLDSIMSNQQELLLEQPLFEMDSIVRVCLHGEPEVANVRLKPTKISITNMLVNQPEYRVIFIENRSKFLPITVVYEKVPFIQVVPKRIKLEANESFEVQVILNAPNLGEIKSRLKFQLYHHASPIYDNCGKELLVGMGCIDVRMNAMAITKEPNTKINTGITPEYLNEVGKNTADVRFNSKVSFPVAAIDRKTRNNFKYSKEMIAFPNDRNKSLRPWDCPTKCITIYAKIPRFINTIDEYKITESQALLKKSTRSYYSKYLQEDRMEQLKKIYENKLPDYELTSIKQYLMYRYFVETPSLNVNEVPIVVDGFIPLAPAQLNNIQIHPMHIVVGRVAAYSKISESFKIYNNNLNSIRVFIVPEKQRFIFPNGDAMMIKGKSNKTIKFNFFSEYEGSHSLCIRVVVNESHIFELTMFVQVVPKVLSIRNSHIFFGPEDSTHKYVNLVNPLNVPIEFNWEITPSNFMIEPMSGRVLSKKAMSCLITYVPQLKKGNDVSVHLINSTHHKRRISLTVDPGEITTHLTDDKLNFGYVGINIQQTRTTILWNLSNYTVWYKVVNPEPMSGVDITPTTGIIVSRGCQIFKVTVNSVECCSFSHIINILINDTVEQALLITGNILFPDIKFRPNPLKLRKFPVTSFMSFIMEIENKSKASAILSFDYQPYPEWSLSETADSERLSMASFTLEPDCKKSVNIHIYPNDVTSYWFNMAIAINKILGPPKGSVLISTKTKTYIKDAGPKLPQNIPLMRVTNVIHESIIFISKYCFDFFYTPYHQESNVTTDRLIIRNMSEQLVEMCIRTDNLAPPFSLEQDSDLYLISNMYSLVWKMEPQEAIEFRIDYTPDEIGIKTCSLPFYIRDDYMEKVHNFIKLTGKYQLPEIILPNVIFFDFMPLKFKFEKTATIQLKCHATNCLLNVESDNENIQTLVMTSQRTLQDNVEVSFIYYSPVGESINSTLVFSCTCGSQAEVMCIGAAENSLMTNYKITKFVDSRNKTSMQNISRCSDFQFDPHGSHNVTRSQSTFPYFPEEEDEDYAFLCQTVRVLEKWLYTQAFNGKCYFTIPDSFATPIKMPNVGAVDPRKPKATLTILPYIELLKNIGSKSIAAQFQTELPTKLVDKVRHLFCLNNNIIEFLKSQNAFIPHVQAEYLLNYEDYVFYITRLKNDCTKLTDDIPYLSERSFLSLSKQSWMDIILQTMKIFIIGRIKVASCTDDPSDMVSVSVTTFNSSISKRETSLKSFECMRYSENENLSLHSIYSKEEIFLLQWLEFYFYNHIGLICDGNLDVIRDKQIDNFDSCLTDGHVFAALTMAHCPYLKKYFDNLYWEPANREQYHHNAARIIEAWKSVNFTFMIVPHNIYEPNNVEMALLVCYLYDFLPSLIPKTEINVKANLSASTDIKIAILNTNSFAVQYELLFFQNEHKCFAESKKNITIRPKSSEKLLIKYTAKYIRKVQTILLLSGEILGKKYSKSMSYTLIGEPDITYITSSFHISIPLYSYQDLTIDIQSPYKIAACYDLYFTMEEPTTLNKLALIDYKEILRNRLPCKFNFPTSEVYCNEDGCATISFIGLSLTFLERHIWFYLLNAEIGDFCIRMSVDSKQSKEVEMLYLTIPEDLYACKCICQEKGPKFCRKFVKLSIPKVNFLFLNTYSSLFIKLKGENEEFWSSYLKRISAIRHMKKILLASNNLDMVNIISILSDTRHFKAKIIGGASDITWAPELTISDICFVGPESFVDLQIHIGYTEIKSFMLQLWNENNKELRKYKVNINNIYR